MNDINLSEIYKRSGSGLDALSLYIHSEEFVTVIYSSKGKSDNQLKLFINRDYTFSSAYFNWIHCELSFDDKCELIDYLSNKKPECQFFMKMKLAAYFKGDNK
jgi:hypothetical protein